ncbi:MAG: SCO family protein, partial [Balneolaceae bacterium]|nr:SCO family protein [Balneolaceae bacterium]
LLQPVAAIGQLNNSKPDNLQDVGIEERLGEKLPMHLKFADSSGDSLTIGELFNSDKPVLLNPVYYECPMLCTMVIDAVYTGVRQLKWKPGDDYTIITFSIDPDEDHQLASATKKEILNKLGQPGAEEGWHFLTGKPESIRQLTDAAGFNYQKIDQRGEFRKSEYAHAAAIMFLSPDASLTRYLYGIKFDEFNMRNALYEAADGKIGNTVDQVLMYCYQYDPDSNSYVPVAWRIMQVGGLVTFLILGIFLGFLWLKEKDTPNDIQESQFDN